MKLKVKDLNDRNSAIFKKWGIEVSPELSLDDAEAKLTELLNTLAYHETALVKQRGIAKNLTLGFEFSADVEVFRRIKEKLELGLDQNGEII